jgi:hypothetical protein
MALPKIEYPTYTIQLQSVKDPVRFRPFLVKEQKLLMMAVESTNPETIVHALVQIINNCVLDEIDVTKLPLVDLEFFFLNLRARSVGENVDIYFKCKNIVEEKECDMVIDMSVDLLNEVQIINLAAAKKIMFNNKVGVLMRYPSINQLKIEDEDPVQAQVKLMVDCIDKIFDEESVIDADESSEEELIEFVNNLSSNDYDKLLSFTKTTPTVQYSKQHNCPRCGFEHNMVLEGLNDFFL